MPSGRDIKSSIESIGKTKKITRAMEMVSASKLRVAKQMMESGQFYADTAREIVMQHLSCGHLEYKHPYMNQRKIKSVGFIVVSTDRGLCGPLNSNLFKLSLQKIQSYHEQNVSVKLALFGHKSESFFKQFADFEVMSYVHHMKDKPDVTDVIGPVQIMLDKFVQGGIDKLYLLSNKFINTIKQEPTCVQLLPVEKEDQANTKSWDYIYEPDAKALLDMLLQRYIESSVLQGVRENMACERASSMMAMKTATDNANELIKTLKKEYNKARQAAITREIAEIVSGSDAV
ncbi:MAG: F0F1 ATP synthase subunit gamma [Thiotrichales bacterium]|nr:MAG: F0F1 ATP synthase subunit gamma [Thiotrichales bacterium]